MEKMNCNTVINQQPSALPASDRSAPESQGRGKKSHEKLLNDNQEAQMTLKEFTGPEWSSVYTNGNRINYVYYERRV